VSTRSTQFSGYTFPKARKDSISEGKDSTQLWAMVPRNGNAEHFSGHDVGGGGRSADESGPRGAQASVRPLGAAHPEFNDGIAGCGNHDPGGFRGHQGLKIDDVQEGGFDELGLREGGGDADDRFLRENERPFRDGV